MSDFASFLTRRRLLHAAGGACASLLCPAHGARAQAAGGMGEVYVNGQRAPMNVRLHPGDRVLTGPDSTLTVAIGEDAFRLRPLTFVQFEGAAGDTLVSGLRVLTGALLGAFRKHERRELKTATATIGIRGTAVYVEANPVLTYVCTCYGNVDLKYNADQSTQHVAARNHTPNYVFAQVLSGRSIMAAPVMNHTNRELAELEKLAGRMPVLPV